MNLEQLYIENERLIYWILHNKFPEYEFDDDIKQCGRLGLWKACLNYDANKSKFATFAYRVIYNEILMEFRRLRRSFPRGFVKVSLEDTINEDFTFEDIIGEEDINFTSSFITHYMSSISEEKRYIFDLYLKGYKQKEIGDMIGKSQAQVSRVIKQVRADLTE